jgi:hypothetical protein
MSPDFIFGHEMEGAETNTFSSTVDKINLRKLTGEEEPTCGEQHYMYEVC